VTKISELLQKGQTFSFEFFPPKNQAEHDLLVRTLRELEPLKPSFVSVTYRGGRSSRERTYNLVVGMLKTTSLNPMAHLICVAHTRLELAEILVDFRKAGVENLMALGGDPPENPEEQAGELKYAIELVQLARAIGGFSIGVAAHPLGHPRSISLTQDREYLASKLSLADFAITQFFFRLDDYVGLIEDLKKLKITKPVIPGIMPITSLSSIPRMAQMGAEVPKEIQLRLQKAYDQGVSEADSKEKVRLLGIEISAQLCSELLNLNAPGLHFYTLNRSAATREIYRSLGLNP